MTIRFPCKHCGRRLNAERRKAGAEVSCPDCQGRIRVPFESMEATTEVEWVYAEGESTAAERLTRDKVTVSRRVLFAQGILLGAVGVSSFLLGSWFNPSTGRTPARDGPQPVRVRGTVSFRSRRGAELPDSGAVVIVLPQDRQPGSNERPSVEGLRPGDPVPAGDNQGVTTIRLLGGGVTRAGIDGSFEIELPDVDRYYLLVISNHKDRDRGAALDKSDLAQIGRYFLPAMEMLGTREYFWEAENIREDSTFEIAFTR